MVSLILTTKRCSECREEKSLEEFHKWTRARDGHRAQCKTCRKIDRRKKFQPLLRSKEEYLHLHTLESCEDPGTKVCVVCKTMKSLEKFSPNSGYRKGVFSRCKACERVRGVERYSPDARRKRALAQYGLDEDLYSGLLETQGGKCAICGSLEGRSGLDLFVDHDHDTGAIRGLLCGNCNTGIGMLGDDPDRLETATAYLRKHKGET